MGKDRIIDSHNHLWKIGGKHFDWINDQMSAIRRDFTIEDLSKTLEENQVEGSILVQAVPEIEETNWLLDIAKENDLIKGVIGWCDIAKGKEEVSLRLDSFLERSKLLKGIRYMSQDLPPSHLLEENFQEGVREVGRRGLVYELLIKHDQLDESIKLVEACPDTVFVVEHIAKPAIASGQIDRWAQDMRRLASISDRVNCKLSGMVTEADWKTWTYEDLEPYIRVVFEAFGEDRIVFGSDWPVLLVAAEYGQVLGILKTWLDKNGGFDRDKIFYQNAKRIYKL